jgi:hypothetical protein
MVGPRDRRWVADNCFDLYGMPSVLVVFIVFIVFIVCERRPAVG